MTTYYIVALSLLLGLSKTCKPYTGESISECKQAKDGSLSQNTQSLKTQAPQGFSGCLDIDIDEINNKNFLSASLRVH